MPIFTTEAKNLMLDALDAIGFLSLHTEYSGLGVNEVTGGTPAYARQAVTWSPAAAGQKMTASGVTFNVPTGVTVSFVGLFSAVTGGTFYGMLPYAAGALYPFTVSDTSTDVLALPFNPFVDDDKVVLWSSGSILLPLPVPAGLILTVINSTTDTLQLSEFPPTPTNLTFKGSGFVQLVIPQTFVAQGLLAVNGVILDVNAA